MSPRIDLPGGLGGFHIPPGWRKPCRTRHWNDGVLTASAPPLSLSGGSWYRFSEIPAGLVSDGAGGAFTLAVDNNLWSWSQGPFALRHVSAAGAPGPLVQFGEPRWWAGVLGMWTEAALVASGPGRCIVAVGKSYTYFRPGLVAQRFDSSGRPLWRGKGGRLLSNEFGFPY